MAYDLSSCSAQRRDLGVATGWALGLSGGPAPVVEMATLGQVDCRRYGVVKRLIELFTPSLLPLASIVSTE